MTSPTISGPVTTAADIEAWQDWHERRLAGATGDLGWAALTGTHWVTGAAAAEAAEDSAHPGLPGRWHLAGDSVVGVELPARYSTTGRVQLRPGESVDDGSVLNFNRAHLPPCAFSEHFLCPTPVSANKLEFSVEAGEKWSIFGE